MVAEILVEVDTALPEQSFLLPMHASFQSRILFDILSLCGSVC